VIIDKLTPTILLNKYLKMNSIIWRYRQFI